MNFNNILFLDIETVSQQEAYQHLDEEWKEFWDHKAKFLIRNHETDNSESVYDRAAIYAEFGKIVCISCGYIQGNGGDRKFIVKSYCGNDERRLLKEFAQMLQSWSGNA